MKYIISLFLSMMLLVSCTPKISKSISFDAQVSDLNGTWQVIFPEPDKITEKEILEYRKKAHADPAMDVQYSWGTGSFNVNGSWYFDITDTAHVFYDGSFLYNVLEKTKTGVSSIDLLMIFFSDKYNLKEKEFFKVSEKETIKLRILFIDEDKIEITNPDKKIFIQTGGPIYLYRLSGPRMPVDR